MDNKIIVSMLLVVRNAEQYINKSLCSLINQGFKKNEYEIIIIDGISEDKTKYIAKEILEKENINYTILDNPKLNLSSGWNIGIKNAKGKYIVRPDAHGALHNNYIKYGLEILKEKKDVVAVGGVLETKAKGFWGNIIKEALSSKVGVGNSSFRTAKKSGYYDTAVYAVYRKEIFNKVGYFDENLIRHQDNDMHKRIKDIGGKFYLDIRMKADYYCRDTILKLLKQMFNIGKYLPDVFKIGGASLRHLAPFSFYFFLLLFFILGIFHNVFLYIGLFIFLLYLSIIALDSFYRSIKKKNISILLNIFIIPLMHMSYALGTFIGLIRKIKRKQS
jgi:glycosyltransferase involved in cell wall biosynthesis